MEPLNREAIPQEQVLQMLVRHTFYLADVDGCLETLSLEGLRDGVAQTRFVACEVVGSPSSFPRKKKKDSTGSSPNKKKKTS